MFAQRHQKLVVELTRVMAVAVALLMLTVLTVSRSQAAFSDTTVNAANSFDTGTVTIVDDSTTVLFNAAGMSPGNPVVNCILVTYTGDILDADVKLYGTSSGALAPNLNVTIEVGDGGAFNSCAGFVADVGAPLYTGTLSGFSTAHTGWLNGLNVFTATATPGSEFKTLQFTVEAATTAAQNTTAAADFTWEVQDQ